MKGLEWKEVFKMKGKDVGGGVWNEVGGAYMPKGFPGEDGGKGGVWGTYLGGTKVQQVLQGLPQGAQLLFQAAVCVPNPLSLLRSQKDGDTGLVCPPTRSSPTPFFPQLTMRKRSLVAGALSVIWTTIPKSLFAQTTRIPRVYMEPTIPISC